MLRLTRDGFEFCFVISSAHTMDLHIEHGMVEFPEYALGTRQDGSVVMQEIHPMMDIEPIGLLVGDITDDDGLFLSMMLHYFAQRILHGDAMGIHPFSDQQEKLVECLVLQRVVNLSAPSVGLYPERYRRNPFPVAEMSQVEAHRLSAGHHFIECFGILEHHPPFHLLAAHRHQLNRLRKIVAEPLVEILLNAPQLLLRLFGESTLQVFPHYLQAVSAHMVDQQVQYVCKEVMHPEG